MRNIKIACCGTLKMLVAYELDVFLALLFFEALQQNLWFQWLR